MYCPRRKQKKTIMNLYNPTALFTLLFLLIPSLAAPGPAAREVAPRAAAASVKYCDPKTTVCWSQYTSAAGVQYRLAVDDTAKAGAAFPVVLQIVAPKAVGWAGICFGGAMANNPLAIGWANGAKAMVSSRRSA